MRRGHPIAASSLVALVVVLSTTPAAADYTEAAPVRPLTMSDVAGLTTVGLDFQLTKWSVDGPPKQDFTGLTFDLDADIRLAPHWMLLLRLPLSHLSIDDGGASSCCDTALDNLTIGGRGLWATIFGDDTRSILGAELAVSLPTASDSAERGPSAAGAALAHLALDPGLWAPNTTTVRFHGLWQFYGRYFMLHGEAGLQLYFFDSDVPGDSLDLGLRLAIGGGFRATYTLSILAEINALFVSSDSKFLATDDTVTSLDFGLRYGSGRAIASARLYFPLDPQLRDLGMIGFGADVGLRF